MSARITITAGTGFDRDGNALDAQRVTQALATIRAMLAGMFGGYTEVDTSGGWANPEGELVMETGKRWTVVEVEEMGAPVEVGNVAAITRVAARRMAQTIATELRQASVLLEVEPVPMAAFVEPERIAA